MNDMKRKIARGAGVLIIAVAAGHFVQQSAASRKPPAHQEARAEDVLSAKPKHLETVAATGEEAAVTSGSADATMAKPAAGTPKFVLPPLASLPVNPPVIDVKPEAVQAATVQPEPAATEVAATDAAAPGTDCAPMLDLLSDDMAMIGVTLIAPCQPDQPFTLRHGGLVINQRTNAKGSFFAFVPALERDASVEVAFKDGQEISGQVEVPALDGLRRVSLIWQAPDAFGIQALESGASYGDTNAVSADNPQTPMPGTMPVSGYLVRIGDGSDEAGLMAEVYTYPAAGENDVDVLIEAAVTPQSCGREVYAQLIQTTDGVNQDQELVMTLPECDGESGFLVLNNLAGEQSIAALK